MEECDQGMEECNQGMEECINARCPVSERAIGRIGGP
jgi:hypothetical protein